MKITYDPEKDILQIVLADKPVEETAQITPGLILDYDENDHLVGLELRKASKAMDNPYSIAYLVGEADLNKPRPTVRE
ncbi:MAG: DUF2283 domain-containing protein [Synechococcales bacterium]|nr:DUF2283 domain-containing protein [Synechococcales bacterium]